MTCRSKPPPPVLQTSWWFSINIYTNIQFFDIRTKDWFWTIFGPLWAEVTKNGVLFKNRALSLFCVPNKGAQVRKSTTSRTGGWVPWVVRKVYYFMIFCQKSEITYFVPFCPIKTLENAERNVLKLISPLYTINPPKYCQNYGQPGTKL